MFKSVFISIAILLFLFSSGSVSSAQQQYVTDTFRITLRTGPSTENKIITMLPSGTPLEVLETSGEWSNVRFTEDEEVKTGWVLQRYLTTETPCRLRIDALQRERNQQRDRLQSLEKRLAEKTDLERKSSKELENTLASLEKVTNEYETLKKGSADFLALQAEHEATQTELSKTRDSLELITAKYDELKSSERKKWFLIGAGVILFGILVGVILGRREKKRKSVYF
jgi:SH3 domain protein